MLTSESIENLAPALVAAQAATGNLVKDRANEFLKSSYATLNAVLDAVREPLQANGFAIVQAGGEAIEGGIVVRTRLLHQSGEWIEESTAIYLAKRDAQATGSAITYGRRYTLQSMMGIAPVDDDDGDAASEIDPQKRRDKNALRPPTDKQLAELRAEFERNGATPENIAATVLQASGGRTDEIEALLQVEVKPLIVRLAKRFQAQNAIN